MATYFKIRLAYKRTHEGVILETTGSELALPILQQCIDANAGPAPTRVLGDAAFTFTSTEFPTQQGSCYRLCEAMDAGSTFVRGILMILPGESTHLHTYHALLKDKHSLRRDLNLLLHNSQTAPPQFSLPRIDMQKAYARKEERYLQADRQLLHLRPGWSGIKVVSLYSDFVARSSSDAVGGSSVADSVSFIPKVLIDEDEYFASVLLSSQYAAAVPKAIRYSSMLPTECITKLFEESLLSRHPTGDGWEDKGSAYFKTTLEYFLRRGGPIQFCLPAFPCKSTNPKKTSGSAPDAAEHEAFYHLHQFCIDLQKIYPPGADFTVVSDGHVFSDCIGTDDDQVYKYTDEVKRLSEMIYSKLCGPKGRSPIRFVNLRDVFYGHNNFLYSAIEHDKSTSKANSKRAKTGLYRPITTQINPLDEFCREWMLRSCGFDAGMLEKAIKDDENHPLTKVYRGFSRFMKDDLDNHPDFKHQSASKRGDLANGVAKEMLRRNQAYSHLVELLNPRAIRISIHQHTNYGPKFAINTLSREKVQAIQSLGDIRSSKDGGIDAKVEEAHIPTPWHNVLIEIEGHDMTYIGKNGIVLDEKKDPVSPFTCDFRDDGRGARWVLKRRI